MAYCTDFYWRGTAFRITVLKDWTEFPWDFYVGLVPRRTLRGNSRFLIKDLIDAMTGPEGEGFFTIYEAKQAFARAMLLLQRGGWRDLSWNFTWRKC